MAEGGAVKSAAEDYSYSWTTGGDKCIQHQSLIDVGGYGEVHQVGPDSIDANIRCRIREPTMCHPVLRVF
jgi:hypothetical protein